MEEKIENVLKQEWLKNPMESSNFGSMCFNFAMLTLLANAVSKYFTPWKLFFFYLFVVFFDVLIFGFVWTLTAKFSFEQDCFGFVQGSSIFKSDKIHYEKVIYANKHRQGTSYSLTLEVWFGRKPVVFWERLPNIEGRTEEVYNGKGMEAHYWSKKPGKIDELARFIDMYNAQAKVD